MGKILHGFCSIIYSMRNNKEYKFKEAFDEIGEIGQ